MVGAESSRNAEYLDVAVAVFQSAPALAGTLQTVGEGIVEGHVLGVVNLEGRERGFHLADEGAHVAFLTVAVVEVEHEHGDVVLGACVAAEDAEVLALQDVAAPHVVEQAVGVGNLAIALQQTGAQQLRDDPLDVAVAHAFETQGDGFVHTVELLAGALGVGHLVVGEGHVVARTQHAVGIVGQRVGDKLQGLVREGQTGVGVTVAVDESLLVEAVGTRPQQGVCRRLVATAGKQQNQRCEEQE